MKIAVILVLAEAVLGLSGTTFALTADEQGIIKAPTLQILDTCKTAGTSLFECPDDQITKGLLGKVVDGLFVVLLFLSAALITLAGYSFLTAGGDSVKLKKSRDFVLYALVGIGVAFLARALVGLVNYYLS